MNQPPQQATTPTPQKQHNLRITTINDAGGGDKIVGSVHVPRSYSIVQEAPEKKNIPRRHVNLRLMGREVVTTTVPQNDDNDDGSSSKDDQHQTTEHVFWERRATWDLLDRALYNKSNDSDWIRLDFRLSLANDLPPSFNETTTKSKRNKQDNSNHLQSKFRVEYVLHAMLLESGTILLDQSNDNPPLRIPRTQRLIYQPTHSKVTLQFDKTFQQFQPMICGLWDQKMKTYSLQTTYTMIRWCPTQQSEVNICLTDPQQVFVPNAAAAMTTFSGQYYYRYRLECRLEQRIEWETPLPKDTKKKKNDSTVNVEESSWTLEPALYWKGGGGSDGTSIIVDGEMVLPVDGVRESYAGKLVRIEHSVIFLVHQKNAMLAGEWQRVATSSRVPVQIEL